MADDIERAFRLTIEVFPSLAFFVPDKLAWEVEAILAEHETKIRATVLEILKDARSAETLADSSVLLFNSVMDVGTELLRAALDRAAWIDDNNPPEVYDGTADALYQDALDFAKQKYESVASEIPGFGSEIRADLVAAMRKEWLRIREEAKQDVHEWSQKIREQSAERDQGDISDGTAPGDVTNERTPGPISVRWPAKGSTDRPSLTDPIWTVRPTQKDPIPVTRLSGKVDWIDPSKTNVPDDAVLTPEDERRIAEVTLAGRSELRSDVEAAFGGPTWPPAAAIVEPFRRYAVKVFDVNATAFRNSAPTPGDDSDEVLGAMAGNLLVEVFGREWERCPGEQVIRTDWQQGKEGWKGREFIVIAGNDPDPTCLYHQVIGDAIKYRYRFHDVLPPPIPGEPPGINLSNLEWWQYIGLNERHNLAMAIKPYLDDRVEYWQHQFSHEASAPSELEGESGTAKSTDSDQSTQTESAATSIRTPTTAEMSSSNVAMAMQSPTRIKFEAGLALAEVTLNQDVKEQGPSLEVARKYVTSATLTLAKCVLTPDCAEPYEAIRRAYDFAEWFAAETMKTAWVWLCVFSEMNTSGKMEKYKREGRTENGAPKGMSDAEIREWHSCLYGVAHQALDEFVPEFWKERLQYFSNAAESLNAPSRATSEEGVPTTTGQSAGDGRGPAVENTGALPADSGAPRQSIKLRPGKERKGDASLLAGKRAVNFRTAEQYLGLTERQRQNLVKDHVLVVEGKGQNKKITTDSLRAYLPPENPN